MRYALTIFIILFLIASWTAYYFFTVSRDQDQTAKRLDEKTRIELDDALESRDSINSVSDSVALAEINKRKADSVSGALREKVFQKRFNGQMSQIARLKEERTRAGIEVDTLTSEIELRSDSLILAQSEEITALKVDLSVIKESFEHEIASIEAKLVGERDATVKAITRVDVLEKQLVKAERKLTGWKILAGVLAAAFIIDEARE